LLNGCWRDLRGQNCRDSGFGSPKGFEMGLFIRCGIRLSVSYNQFIVFFGIFSVDRGAHEMVALQSMHEEKDCYMGTKELRRNQ
jgi:hypothetical protein